MIGVIPNPTKTITIDFPIEKVKEATRNIDKLMKFCHFREENDTFNSYKFSRSEFLSMGSLIDINLNSLSENKTQINIEISRQMGAFDEWVEVHKANKHIEETINSIADIIKNGVPIKEEIVKPVVVTDSSPMSKVTALLTILGALGLLILGLVFIFKMITS
jgi:hypothetical protein